MVFDEFTIELFYYLLLFITPIVIRLVFLRENVEKFGVYSLPGWYHSLKVLYAKYRLSSHFYNFTDKNPIPAREDPQKICFTEWSDSYFVTGLDQNGNGFQLRIIRKKDHAIVFLYIFLGDGSKYILPGTTETLSITRNNSWTVGGFNVEILEPFKRHRITFAGILRRVKENADSFHHVRFNFIWSCAGRPLFYPDHANTDLVADALATEKWRDGDWGTETGYEQFGSLRGTIEGENIPDGYELNFASSRKHYLGVADSIALHREFSVFGTAEDGTTFNMGAKSFRHGCSHLRYGNMIFNNTEVHSLKSNDINLAYVGERGFIYPTLVLHFSAGKRNFKTVIRIKESTTVYAEGNGWQLRTVMGNCDLNSGQAKVLLSFWYRRTCAEIFKQPELLTNLITDHEPQELIVDLQDVNSTVTSLTGGKGASLGMLTSLKSKLFTVPSGFIVTVQSFEKQLAEKPNLSVAIQQLETYPDKNCKEFFEACDRVAELFSNEPPARTIAVQVLSALHTLQINEKWKWAVRSSGVEEDCAELSAAGQNATFLGCATDAEILKAVSSCWGSLFTHQSVRYRREHGLPISTGIAVVIQKMVPSDCAGILFTCHPTTGDTSQMVITANFGLGESVVSGQTDPDTFLLHKSWEGSVSVISKIAGEKANVIRAGEVSGVEHENTDNKDVMCITDDQAVILGRIGVHLEVLFGGPRDIEWAFYQNEVYLLQSRPVTALNAWNEFELSHEFDCAILSNEDAVYTKANCGEVIPGALTALSQSISARAIDKAFQLTRNNFYDPFTMKGLTICWHQAFLDVANGINYSSSASLDDISTKVVDLAIFGHLVYDERLQNISLNRNDGKQNRLESFWIMLDYIKIVWKNKEALAEAKRLNDRVHIEIKNSDVETDIYDKIDKYMETLDRICWCHCITSSACIFYQILTMSILAGKSKELTSDHLSDIALLLSSCESVVSAQVPQMLEEIATTVREEGLSMEFAKLKPSEGVQWLKTNCLSAHNQLETFLKVHGHRMFKEFELKQDNWSTKPGQVIEMIQANVLSESHCQKPQSQKIEETLELLKTPTNGVIKKILSILVKNCRKSVGYREQTKSELIRSINKIRTAYRELARKLEHKGFIPQKSLIYYFTHREVKDVMNRSNPILVLKATKRAKLYQKWDSFTFPEISFGIPVPDQSKQSGTVPKHFVLEATGTAVCPGEITSRVCVVKSLSEIGQLSAGDVLITVCTDIAWSPYFPMLGGVVTELGGIISHGAVVAREYGLPCIVGVKNATTIFNTGDQITMSGKTGVIKKLSAPVDQQK